MRRIVGYTDRASVQAGGEISCHVSLLAEEEAAEAEYRARLVRIVGVEEADGSERVEPSPSTIDGSYTARVEETENGSYGVAELALGDPPVDSLVVELTFMTTLLDGREQALLSICEAVAGGVVELSLVLDAAGRPGVIIADGARGAQALRLSEPVTPWRWYTIVGGFEGGEAFAKVTAIDDPDFAVTDGRETLDTSPQFAAPKALFACRPASGDRAERLASKFTGRLEGPSVRRSLAESGQPLATWDFGHEPGSFAIQDVSGNENHGELFGLPKRSVTGSRWDRQTISIHEAPDQYRAVHFSADAIEDAAWPAAFSLRVPPELRSGLYAFVLESGDDRDVVPFVVSPAPSPVADVLLVLPTATYMAYSNARFMWEKVLWEVQRERSTEFGREEQILVAHPELGASSYDQYLDGTNVTSVSWRRPNLDMRAGQCRGEAYPSDLRLIDWLERSGYRYEVCTDDDLDGAGSDLLSSYRVVLSGTHPEYASSKCYAALESFLTDGGRLAVLGGDAFTWRVAFSSERSWIVEIRTWNNVPTGSRMAAEGHLALTGEFSGDPSAPRPAERLLGTSVASMGFDAPRPYERLPASDGEAARFIFDGVEDRVIGDDTASGGVVFQEWDNAEEVAGFALAEGKPMVLARSTSHTVATRWFGAGKRKAHGEMTFFTVDGGGAAFSVGSMMWCRCLGRPDVSRITANVLDRFLEPAPFENGGHDE